MAEFELQLQQAQSLVQELPELLKNGNPCEDVLQSLEKLIPQMFADVTKHQLKLSAQHQTALAELGQKVQIAQEIGGHWLEENQVELEKLALGSKMQRAYGSS